MSPLKALLKIASSFYFLLLFYIFFLARRRGYPSLSGGDRPLRIIPLTQKIKQIASGRYFSRKEEWNFYIDLFGNILIFIPFVFFLVFAYNIKSPGKVILIAFLTSLFVETIQFTLHLGVADIDDVILNTLGACIGAFAIRLVRKSKHPVIQKLGSAVLK